MEDQHVGRLLRELPRERASNGFTARVLDHLDRPAAPARQAPARLRWAVVTAAALLLSTGSFLEWRDQRQTAALLEDATEARQLLEELRVEHDRLSRDLRSLNDPSAPEVLYLGGDETMDLVVDLDRVREEEGEMVPVAYHEQTF